MQFAPDWFITNEWIDMYHRYHDYYEKGKFFLSGIMMIKINFFEWYDDNNYNFFEWNDGYQKFKTQKAQIKKELLPIALYPSRWWEWCVPEEEKSDTAALWV